ncbi:DJ-1/PfpI family protein [Paenibacillus naphthalenovorans]|uniref:Glutamine amidotransferase n=1 Tax=Paenibacillus naphthalenovorans TaxID=162209 RepID=A0A0U2WB58_9BACL|nr:DJ-1/PfpI family protein [Paenibacillus naphthalenovorans]ALS24725.1 glutamine amidotransferase [Paenibacillus naphthalenovorans]
MKKLLLRFVVYLCSFVVFVGGVGAFGYFRSQKDFYGSVRQEPVPSLQGIKQPEYDPNKPTVAVLLGNETTEGLDFMTPYQLFSMTGAYNVFAVAADNQVKSLTGGLDVVPHYSFKEMDELLGKSPDIIAIPYMTMLDQKNYQPVREWIQQHKETTLLSICAGADNLAATGLLNGKSAASHWQTMWILSKKYPEVNWKRDLRYVTNDDHVISSAGISSGIDAVLYVISQKLGDPMAAKIAKELNYPSYHFLQNPKVEPFYIDLRYATYVLNNAFQWNKKKAGVLLYDGMEEMALASVFDIYSDTGTTKVLSVSSADAPIVTKHGLNLLSRYTMSNAPQLDKMIVSGTQAKSLAAEDIKNWNERGKTTELQLVHSDSPDRFMFEVQLEDLARQEDLQTARHAVKRMEYRANDIHLEGKPFPLETYANLLLTVVISVLAAFYIDRRFIMKKK